MCFNLFFLYPYEGIRDVVNVSMGKESIMVERIPES